MYLVIYQMFGCLPKYKRSFGFEFEFGFVSIVFVAMELCYTQPSIPDHAQRERHLVRKGDSVLGWQIQDSEEIDGKTVGTVERDLTIDPSRSKQQRVPGHTLREIS
eukprot:gb/GECH01007265.1/.p1 GENE.gb/GECH01007265.1/~~gb/GECH01007265.1/.p1  ORF type:complete len:106 (+),score=17.06 gb/GECH01007265.1/:1-318(+)